MSTSTLRFRINHRHALFTFVEALARQRGGIGRFAPRPFRSRRYQSRFEAFANLIPFGASDRPIAMAAAESRTDGQFHERLTTWFPDADAARIVRILDDVRPMYDAQLWTPAMRWLPRWQRLLSERARRGGLDDILLRVAVFYGAGGESDACNGVDAGHAGDAGDVAFQVFLQPALARGWRSASIDADIVTLALDDHPHDPAQLLGIVTHEICHSFDRRRTRPRHRVSSMRTYGYLALEEALATAIGNGWSVARLKGRLPSPPWYDNWHINTYAVALYPLVDEYLSRGTRIDRTFFTRALSIYRDAIGDRRTDYDNVFAHVEILTDGIISAEPDGLSARLAARVDYLADARETHRLDARTLDRLLMRPATRLVVVHVRNTPALLLLRRRLPWLRSLRFRSGEAFAAGEAGGPTPAVIVCVVENLAEFDTALRVLYKNWRRTGVMAWPVPPVGRARRARGVRM